MSKATLEAVIGGAISDELGGIAGDWVLIFQGVRADGEMREDVVVPEHQLLTHTAGLLRMASATCDQHMVNAHTEP